METSMKEILNVSILLEEKVSQFYSLLAALFKEDALFWNGLAKEEDKHASLISSLMEFHSERKILYPRDAFPSSTGEINDAIRTINSLINEYMTAPPDRKDAYLKAIEIEDSAGEYTFQLAATSSQKSAEHRLFKMLVGYEKDHAKRIREKMDRSLGE